MSKQHGFIFDMDGVLVDSNPIHKIALKQFCQKLGYDLTEQQLREKIYGRTNRDWIRNLIGNLDDGTVRRYADEKEALFRNLYTDVRPLGGLIGFLDQIRQQGMPRAIATSAPRANVDFTLAATGMGVYFDTILDDSCVTTGKPDPEIYLKSAAALALDPEQCVVLEDSLSGVLAGKRAGCKVVGITTTHTHKELSLADLIINDFVGLAPEKLLSGLFSST